MKSMKFTGLALLGVALLSSTAMAQDKKKIVIATEGAFAPWNFTSPSGEILGLEPDLQKILCERMNVECELILYDWDGMLPGLTGKKFDAIMAGMSITDERSKAINFTNPYVETANGFLVPVDSDLAKMPHTGEKYNLDKDPETGKKVFDEIKPMLKGKVIGVQISTNHTDFANKYYADVAEIKTYPTTEAHDLDLQAGRIDAVTTDQTALKGTLDKPDFAGKYVIVGPGFVGDVLGKGVAVGLRKEDNDLREQFNKAIDSVIADGTLKELSLKWFKVDTVPTK
ncbi:MAG: transporter substrate-binding domain-containing protein [Methylobacteriaceae bacterium]|jgi:octopine/nopaline transport system substrate-binding protein|nr:transporter substrate-binding domain-containing protein [Methylobacteriaceae bacterium]